MLTRVPVVGDIIYRKPEWCGGLPLTARKPYIVKGVKAEGYPNSYNRISIINDNNTVFEFDQDHFYRWYFGEKVTNNLFEG